MATKEEILSGAKSGMFKLGYWDSVTGYKKVLCCKDDKCVPAIATLNMPAWSTILRAQVKRINEDTGEVTFHGPSNKLRTDLAQVTSIDFLDNVLYRPNNKVLHSPDNCDCFALRDQFTSRDNAFKYRIGSTIKPLEPFNTDTNEQCASGIHFFMTEKEACDYIA